MYCSLRDNTQLLRKLRNISSNRSTIGDVHSYPTYAQHLELSILSKNVYFDVLIFIDGSLSLFLLDLPLAHLRG